MPRDGQIIPLYTHPHYEYYINDNTVFNPEVPTVDDGVKVPFIFASHRGRDNVLLKKGNVPAYLEEYGNPDFKLFGQAGHMAYMGLKSEVTTAYCMRVMPPDATYANMILVAVCKWVQKRPSWDTPSSPVRNVMEVYFEARALENVTNDTHQLIAEMRLIEEEESTSEKMVKPIAAFYSLGRGVYGNDFHIRLTSDVQGIKETGLALYNVHIGDTGNPYNTGEVKAEVSLYEDATQNNRSLYIEDVINDNDTGSKSIGIIGNPGAIEELTEFYNARAIKIVDPGKFDIVNGLDIQSRKRYTDIDVLTMASSVRVTGYILTNRGARLTTDKNESILYDRIDEDASPLSITSENGIPLLFGTDGAFGDPDKRDAALKQCYLDAFMGKLDKSIKSTKRTPIHFIFDANYDNDVKLVIQQLIAERGDGQGHMDAGILNNEAETRNYVENVIASSSHNRLIEYDTASMGVKDPFTGRKIDVTYTYQLVYDLTRHVAVNGIEKPFVGAYTNLSGYIKNTIKPEIDSDDKAFKEFLHVNKVNYVEAVGENLFQRGTQVTSQLISSDLSEANNVRIMLAAKRELESLVLELSYDFTKPENIRLFTDNAKRRLKQYSAMVEKLEVNFGMTALEKKRNILHCYLAIVFNPMAKISIIEIDINPRV